MGDDAIFLSFLSAWNLDNLPDPVAFFGGPGDDFADLWDDNQSRGDWYTITNSSITRAIFGGLSYDSEVETIFLGTGPGDDLIDVESTSASAVTVLYLQDGDDTVNLAPTAQDLDQLPGAVEVYGGAGFDTVNLRDDNQPRGDWYTITDSTLSRALFGGLTYAGVGTSRPLDRGWRRSGRCGEHSRPVPSRCLTFRTVTTRLTLLPPPRTWTCCPVRWKSTAEPGSIPSISGMTTSRGAIGTQSPIAPSAGLSFGGLTYDADVELLALWAGDGDDLVDVESTSASALTVLDLQDGDDTVNLAPTAQDLDLLPGAVEVYGGAGFDTVNLRDDNQPRSDWYTITDSTLSWALFGGLTYDADVELLAL